MLVAWPVAGLTTRIGSARIASTDWNAPATRTCTFCVPASTTPEPCTAFCALSCVMTCVDVDAHLGRALLRQLDPDLLRLHAEQLHLRDVVHAQQLRADVLGAHAQFLVAEAVGRQRVDRAVDVAELVVEERADHALRQRRAHVADLLARLVPGVGHLVRRGDQSASCRMVSDSPGLV